MEPSLFRPFFVDLWIGFPARRAWYGHVDMVGKAVFWIVSR